MQPTDLADLADIFLQLRDAASKHSDLCNQRLSEISKIEEEHDQSDEEGPGKKRYAQMCQMGKKYDQLIEHSEANYRILLEEASSKVRDFVPYHVLIKIACDFATDAARCRFAKELIYSHSSDPHLKKYFNDALVHVSLGVS
jgi:hypothetical protein